MRFHCCLLLPLLVSTSKEKENIGSRSWRPGRIGCLFYASASKTATSLLACCLFLAYKTAQQRQREAAGGWKAGQHIPQPALWLHSPVQDSERLWTVSPPGKAALSELLHNGSDVSLSFSWAVTRRWVVTLPALGVPAGRAALDELHESAV